MASSPPCAAAGVPSWLRLLVKVRYPLLLAATLLPALIGIHDAGDWNLFFQPAAEVLAGRGPVGPLSLYAAMPAVQVGPAALLVALPVALLPHGSAEVATLIGAAGWVAIVAGAERVALRLRPDDAARHALTALTAGAAGAVLWRHMAYFRHLEDVLVLLAAVAATGAVAHRRPALLGVALGLGLAAKPWGFGLLALALALPGARPRVVATAVAGAVATAFWAPFVLHSPGTVSALATFRPDVAARSSLTLLGVAADAPMPAWVRLVQLVVSLLLAAVAVRQGRWLAVPLVVVAARLGLDPFSWPYYYAGLAAAALVWDLTGSMRRVPVWTLAVLLVHYDIRWLLTSYTAAAALNLAVLLAAGVLAVAPQGAAARLPRPGRRADAALRAATPLPAEPSGTSPTRIR